MDNLVPKLRHRSYLGFNSQRNSCFSRLSEINSQSKLSIAHSEHIAEPRGSFLHATDTYTPSHLPQPHILYYSLVYIHLR